jgi:hypothetical protein
MHFLGSFLLKQCHSVVSIKVVSRFPFVLKKVIFEPIIVFFGNKASPIYENS